MIALVTGANKGIGLETVRQLANEGHTVYLGSRNIDKGLEAKKQIGDDDHVKVMQLDVTDTASVEKAYQTIVTEFGQLDILINNAGINYDTWQNTLNADLENVRETLETNLFGAWSMLQTFIPLMERNNYGRVVNVSSGSGALTGMASGTPGYSISKTALNVLTIKTAQLVSHNVLINSVCPGWVRTEMGGSSAPRSVSEGAETIVWAANLPKGAPSGKFFRDKKEISL